MVSMQNPYLPTTTPRRWRCLCCLGFEMTLSGWAAVGLTRARTACLGTRLEQALLRHPVHTNIYASTVQMKEKSSLWLNLLIYRKWFEDKNRTKKMLPTSQMYHLLRKTRLVCRTWCFLRKLIFIAHNNTKFLVTTALPILQYKTALVQVHVSFISLFSSLQSLRKAFRCVQCCLAVTGTNSPAHRCTMELVWLQKSEVTGLFKHSMLQSGLLLKHLLADLPYEKNRHLVI